jgi:hypothetical protein
MQPGMVFVVLENGFVWMAHVFPGNRSDDYTKLYATFPPVMRVKMTINLSTTAGQSICTTQKLASFQYTIGQ